MFVVDRTGKTVLVISLVEKKLYIITFNGSYQKRRIWWKEALFNRPYDILVSDHFYFLYWLHFEHYRKFDLKITCQWKTENTKKNKKNKQTKKKQQEDEEERKKEKERKKERNSLWGPPHPPLAHKESIVRSGNHPLTLIHLVGFGLACYKWPACCTCVYIYRCTLV